MHVQNNVLWLTLYRYNGAESCRIAPFSWRWTIDRLL